MVLGFVGAGNMAGAMARGWARSDAAPQMLFCDLDAERAEALAAETGGQTRPDLESLRAESDVFVLAVKPPALDAVAAELGGEAPPVLSVMAATTTERLRAAFPGSPVLRVMPNQPAEVGHGVLVHVAPDPGAETLLSLLDVLGTRVEMAEDQIEGAMAVMSCSPAYVALFAEALASAGTRDGLDERQSMALVTGTLAGTAAMLAERTPAEIRTAVAPPGGATEAGLEALEINGFTGAVDAAVEASLARFR